MGLYRCELNISMKLTLTKQRLEANRKNSMLGGAAHAAACASAYAANPSYCKQCNTILPQSKKNNTFCSKSCSATFNNTIKPKRKSTKVEKNCLQCGNPTFRIYCSKHCGYQAQRRFDDPQEALRYKRSKVKEISANYRAKVRNQTPIDADRQAIQTFYEQCPKGYEVDHIIPISKGGLHTLDNLQYLTITENRKKSNKIL